MKTTLSFFPSHYLGWKNVVMIIIIGLLHDLKVMNNYVTFPNNIHSLFGKQVMKILIR